MARFHANRDGHEGLCKATGSDDVDSVPCGGGGSGRPRRPPPGVFPPHSGTLTVITDRDASLVVAWAVQLWAGAHGC